MKRKGFTLIELLAVIIILAVIALIAVPVVLNVVESAKKSSFESSTYRIVESTDSKTKLVLDSFYTEAGEVYKSAFGSSQTFSTTGIGYELNDKVLE